MTIPNVFTEPCLWHNHSTAVASDGVMVARDPGDVLLLPGLELLRAVENVEVTDQTRRMGPLLDVGLLQFLEVVHVMIISVVLAAAAVAAAASSAACCAASAATGCHATAHRIKASIANCY